MKDTAPKFGMVITSGKSDPYKVFYYVDAQKGYTLERVGVAQQKLGGKDWDWKTGERLTDVKGIKYNNGNYIKLAVLRNGETFYFICNNEVVFEIDNFSVFNDTKESAIGFLSFNTELLIKNYYATANAGEVQQKISQYTSAN